MASRVRGIEFGNVPVVAVLHGAVVGGGLELAAAMHVRVAERSAFYALPEGSRGIFVGGGGSVRLPRLIGVARMMDMMLTGRTIAPKKARLSGSRIIWRRRRRLGQGHRTRRADRRQRGVTNFALTHASAAHRRRRPAAGFATEALMAAIAQDEAEAK